MRPSRVGRWSRVVSSTVLLKDCESLVLRSVARLRACRLRIARVKSEAAVDVVITGGKAPRRRVRAAARQRLAGSAGVHGRATSSGIGCRSCAGEIVAALKGVDLI